MEEDTDKPRDAHEAGLLILEKLVKSGHLLPAWRIKDMLKGMEGHHAALTLIGAEASGWVHAAQLMRDAGADIFARDVTGNTLLHSAALENEPNVMAFLLQTPASALAKEEDTDKPCDAHEAGLLILEKLVKSGHLLPAWRIKDMLKGMEGHHAALTLIGAEASGLVHAAQLMRDAGADIFARDVTGNTLLHSAAYENEPNVMDFLLQTESSLAERMNNNRMTALHIAAMKGHGLCVDVLLRHGVKLNVKARRGHSALHLAALFNKPDCIDLLVKAGASMEQCDSRGRSA